MKPLLESLIINLPIVILGLFDSLLIDVLLFGVLLSFTIIIIKKSWFD